MDYEIVIGLEIHLKLNSKHKLFCTCLNVQEFDDLPANTHVCPVCMWQPGELPVLNEEPLEKAVELGLALGCHVQEISMFDRKSYFYPDLPMWFQITQLSKPTCINWEVTFFVDDDYTIYKTVHIRDAHIEIDSWKSIHIGEKLLLDYNRSWTPLVEIVTYPDFSNADQVVWFLKMLQRIARLYRVSNAEMESGQMRCDVNISLRVEGETALNPRVELKNMSSFSAVRRAIDHEYERQKKLYDEWKSVDQETRGRDDPKTESYVMRSKENAMDYRYMPDPDLPPLKLESHRIDERRRRIQQIPMEADRIRRYKEDYGFNKEYVNWLINDAKVSEYFENVVNLGAYPKTAASWIVWPIASWLATQNKTIDMLLFDTKQFMEFLYLQDNWTLINQHAKTVMQEMLATWKDPQKIIEEKWLKPVDEKEVMKLVDQFFAEKPDVLADLKAGNMKSIWFAIGQVMKMSGGSADPSVVKQLIEEKLK